MKRFYNFIFFVLILFMFLGINNVFATNSAQMQEIEQNVEQVVDKTKKVDSMGTVSYTHLEVYKRQLH